MKSKLDITAIKNRISKLLKMEAKHAAFAVIIVVLLVYLFTVWRIGQLASAEPSDEVQASATSSNSLPKIDPNAIKQIQDLEQRNDQVRSLFNEARNNPFQE